MKSNSILLASALTLSLCGSSLATAGEWVYESSVDEMTSERASVALVASSNTVEFQWPYHGPQRAILALRSHPQHGDDVIFSIKRGQTLCRSYEDCDVMVRFDDGKAIKFRGRGPADHRTDTVIIIGYHSFMQRMMASEKVKIALPIYREGAPVFSFDVSGFSKARYLEEQ